MTSSVINNRSNLRLLQEVLFDTAAETRNAVETGAPKSLLPIPNRQTFHPIVSLLNQ